MEITETTNAVVASISERGIPVAEVALCVAAASIVWSSIMIWRVVSDYYGFKRRSSISSTNVEGHPRRADAEADQTPSSASDAPPCSASSFVTPETDSDAVCSREVEETGLGSSRCDPDPPAKEQPEHGYELPQVGLPHQAVRELLGASQSHPSSRRIVPPNHRPLNS